MPEHANRDYRDYQPYRPSLEGSMAWCVMEPVKIDASLYLRDWKYHWERRKGWRGWVDWLLGSKPVRVWDDDISPSAEMPPIHTYYRRRYRIGGDMPYVTRLAYVYGKAQDEQLWQAIGIGGHGQKLYG